ncbi:hypothetical protein [Streptomyces sp. NPDC088923]|uniref:hypothetical protein n=1 Tax=Streptomyces sp. NPDC088923 TaxID=3365913 RepID=UPI00380AFE3E
MADHPTRRTRTSAPHCPSSGPDMDEALRRARAEQPLHAFPAPLTIQRNARINTPALLRQIAERLEAYAPGDRMHEETRQAAALTWAVRRHGYADRAYEAELLVLRVAPRVELGTTRGEYAAILRRTARRLEEQR